MGNGGGGSFRCGRAFHYTAVTVSLLAAGVSGDSTPVALV